MAKKNIASFGLLAVLIIAMVIGDSSIQSAFGHSNQLDSNDGMRDTFIRALLAGRSVPQREQHIRKDRNGNCAGDYCAYFEHDNPCSDGCICLGGLFVGVCVGSCC